ncbi:MAG: TfoX/Sxy family protein [Cyclobacteriaceae bacterium]|nr:TfoX/Sxy family protein [Cyclobacteriaceae bacterium]
MGIKGDQLTNDASVSSKLLIEKLSSFDGITSKKMFGGYGIFHDGKMFALVNSKGEIYLKTDDTIISKFEDAGAHQHGKMPYFSLPESVLLDQEILAQWAGESIDISK